jgi:hypothetical protein
VVGQFENIIAGFCTNCEIALSPFRATHPLSPL